MPRSGIPIGIDSTNARRQKHSIANVSNSLRAADEIVRRAMPKTLQNKLSRYASIALGFVLTLALGAGANAKNFPLQVEVLSAESYHASGPSEKALEGCTLRDIDAYCFGSSTYMVHNMMVQENGGKPLSILCMAYRWSNCTSLPIDETFPARREGRGIAIQYTDKNGKKRKQVYQIVGGDVQAEQ